MSLDSAYCRETPTISATKEMAIKAINPNITVRSTDMMWDPRFAREDSKRSPRVYVNTVFHISKLGTHTESGELALGWAPEVAMPHERMSVMLWTLTVLSAIMGVLLVLAAA